MAKLKDWDWVYVQALDYSVHADTVIIPNYRSAGGVVGLKRNHAGKEQWRVHENGLQVRKILAVAYDLPYSSEPLPIP